ncbi:MAG: acyl-ACP thioesterase domain-containing protein [Christensenellales bacterium]
MQKTCEKELIVGFTDVDFKERLRPFRAFELFEDLADMHAEQLGIGMESPMMEGYAWVVARNHVQLFSMPKLGRK